MSSTAHAGSLSEELARSLVRHRLERVVRGLTSEEMHFAGFMPAFFDRRRRALPDYIAGTVVVCDNVAAQERFIRSTRDAHLRGENIGRTMGLRWLRGSPGSTPTEGY